MQYKIDFTQLGMQGITLRDFDMLQETNYELSGLMAKAFADGTIIYGCQFTNLTFNSTTSMFDFTMSDGAVVLGGEIVKVSSHSGSAATLKWLKKQTLVQPSPVPFKDGTSKDVHYLIEAVIDDLGTTAITDINIFQYIRNQIIPPTAPLTSLTLSSEWTPGANNVPNPHYIARGGTCHLVGDMKYNSTNPPSILYSALIGDVRVRPLTNQIIPVIACDKDATTGLPINVEVVYIYIQTNGVIILPHTTGKSIVINCSYPIK